jgi:microcystin-dependent protein
MPGTPAVTPFLHLARYDNATDEANFAAQINAIVDRLDSVMKLITPVGGVLDWPSDAPPPASDVVIWLDMNGQMVTPDDYPLLAAAWVKSGPFVIPDRRDRAVVGASGTHAVNDKFGTESHTLTSSQVPNHGHDIDDPGHRHGMGGTTVDGSGGGGAVNIDLNAPRNWYLEVDASGPTGSSKTGVTVKPTTGGGQSHPNTPLSIASRFFVRAA